jgi:drug/metabolite transporter (DMT)-like permease
MQKPMVPGPTHLNAHAAAILFVCCIIWGVGLVMAKISSEGISPILNAALRSIVAGVILFLWTRARGIGVFGSDGTLWAGVICGVFFALEFLFLYVGLTMTRASRGTIFLHCAPFVAAFGEHFLVAGHRLTRLKVLGLAAAFLGLLVALGDNFGAAGGAALTGDLLCLLGGVFWGATTVVVRATQLKHASAEKILLYQLAVSAPCLLLGSWMVGEAGVMALTAQVQAAFAYTVIMVVVIGYTTWFWLMRTYSAASLHSFTFLIPIFGVLAGHLLLGEPITRSLVAGLALVAVGIYLVNRPEPA